MSQIWRLWISKDNRFHGFCSIFESRNCFWKVTIRKGNIGKKNHEIERLTFIITEDPDDDNDGILDVDEEDDDDDDDDGEEEL